MEDQGSRALLLLYATIHGLECAQLYAVALCTPASVNLVRCAINATVLLTALRNTAHAAVSCNWRTLRSYKLHMACHTELHKPDAAAALHHSAFNHTLSPAVPVAPCTVCLAYSANTDTQPKLPPPSRDRFERLVAEAECAVRARSASPLLRPITPQDFAVAAVRPATAGADGRDQPSAAAAAVSRAAAGGSVADRSPVPRSRLGDAGRRLLQQQQHGPLPPLVLPAAATSVGTAMAAAAAATKPSAAGAPRCSGSCYGSSGLDGSQPGAPSGWHTSLGGPSTTSISMRSADRAGAPGFGNEQVCVQVTNQPTNAEAQQTVMCLQVSEHSFHWCSVRLALSSTSFA